MKSYSDLKNTIEDKFVLATSERDMRFYLLCLLALESGARVSDLLKLSWHSVDFELLKVSYMNTKGKKRQSANLTRTLIGYILRYRKTLESNNVYRVTANRRTQKEFGINFHQLRKESAKNVATYKGVVMASKHLGHSRVSTTDIYLGVSEEEFLDGMKTVPM
mgnify:CR=1 FL=1